jgi:alkanesulfonate monooxygenase SsuD/methylene tetrahydromethanopterin reductase-like flavin-dependent oxidoreductase (luciferase family)
LTWLGARTRWLRLGTAVLVLPWHNPVLLAEQTATLDLLSGGRLDFGIGKGYRYNEFAGFCVPMEEAEARFDECLEVILKAWTADEPFSHRGTYWAFDKIVVEPPPAQKPHPEIWMGAGSERSMRQVAKGIGCSASMPRQRMSGTPSRCSKKRPGHGRCFDPMQVGVTRAFFVTDTKADKDAALERRLQNRARQLHLATRPDGTVHGGPDRATGDPRMVNERSAMYGSPDEIVQRLEVLRDAGVGYVLINGGGSGGGARGRESLRRFARDVMPLFAEAARSGLLSDEPPREGIHDKSSTESGHVADAGFLPGGGISPCASGVRSVLIRSIIALS